MGKNNLFNPNQTGFRNHKSTTDQILRLQDTILRNIKNKNTVLGVFLDLEKAYDMLWKRGLLHKINHININGKMFTYIKSFINNRTFHVKVGGKISSVKTSQNGTPQGSVISPTLFLIMINDLSTTSPEIKLSLYADDSAIYTCGKKIEKLRKKIQETLNHIQDWCDSWGFKVSSTKSTAVIFSQNTKQMKLTEELKLNGEILKCDNHVKFLGMIFDSKLTWTRHVNYVEEKCRKRLNLMRSVTGNHWGASKNALITIYRTLIRSIIDYGSIAYDNMCRTNKMKIDSIQYKALKICTGALQGTPLEALQNECGEQPLQLRRKMLQMKYTTKIKSEQEHPANEVLQKNWQLYYGKFNIGQEPLALKMKPFIDSINWTETTNMINQVPPWLNMLKITTDISLKNKFTKQKNNKGITDKITQMITTYENYLQIFTDASSKEIQGKSCTGIGFYIPEIEEALNFRITDNMTIITAELMAIKMALERGLEIQKSDNKNIKNKNILIISDSLNAVEEIQSAGYQKSSMIALQILKLAQRLNKEITIAWIPSHSNILGNDAADQQAKLGRNKEEIDIIVCTSTHEIFKKIDNQILLEWQTCYTNSKKAKWYKEVVPMVSNEIKYSSKRRKKEIIITRLRLGRCFLNHTKQQIGRHTDGLCERCRTPETIEHYLLDCPLSNIGEHIKRYTENKINNMNKILNDERIIDTIFSQIDRDI